jgi:outer membrane lipoprotein carrier protein
VVAPRIFFLDSCYTFVVRRSSFAILPVILVIIAGGRAAAGTTAPAAVPIVRALESRYHNARSLKATFLERYSDARDSGRLESGTVYFSRPGRMRWEYEAPEQKLFVSDGKLVWFFVPADHTASRAPIKESSDWRTPLVLLTGNAKLSQLCDRIDLLNQPATVPGDVTLQCLPRGEKNAQKRAQQQDAGAGPLDPFDRVLIEVNPATGDLADLRVQQPGGVELEYRFANWQENLPLPESLFQFKPPVGVAIVDGAGSAPAAP